jgi:two-component system NtrC family response regulator
LAEVKTSGSLRSDFFHRIAHAVIEIPPLRERIADIEPLASQFVNDVASKDNLPVVGLSDEASAYLRSQSWPGNVRQLQTRVTVATRHAHFENRTEVTPQDFVAFGEGEDSTLKHFSLKEQLHEHEYQVVKEALALHDGNIAHTAAYLKCDRKKIYTVIARHEGRGGEE